MNEVNELWSSPWAELQKHLASGHGVHVAGEAALSNAVGSNAVGCSHAVNSDVAGLQDRAVASTSWLVRARSRKHITHEWSVP